LINVIAESAGGFYPAGTIGTRAIATLIPMRSASTSSTDKTKKGLD